jgi:tetratricopeptide (TPR) repeat protein
MAQHEQPQPLHIHQQGDHPLSLAGDFPQVFQIGGDLYYHAPGAPDTPHAAPLTAIPDPGIFVNREKLLDQVDQFFRRDAEKVFLLEGMGGMGKTAFAAQVCRLFRAYFQDLYWGVCTEESSTDRFLRELASVLTPTPPAEPDWPGRRSPLQTQVQALIQKLALRRCLLVFDDFHILLDAQGQIKKPDLEFLFYELLRGQHHAKLLILSRRSIVFQHQPSGACVRKRMEGLSVAATQNLLVQLGMPLADAQLRAIYHKVAGHPLALRVMADLAHRGLTIQQLLDIPFRNLSQESQEVFDKLFAQLWQMLSAAEKKALQQLAIYRAPVPAEALRALPADADDTRPSLAALVQRLAEHCVVAIHPASHPSANPPPRYTIPPILREFILRSLTAAQWQTYHQGAMRYWLTVMAAQPLAVEGLQAGAEARYHALQTADQVQATALALTLAARLCRCGLGAPAQTLLLETLPTVTTDSDLAAVYHTLGNVYLLQGDYGKADEYYAAARDLYDTLSLDVPKAVNYTQIGQVHAAQGEYALAFIYYQKARDLLQECPDGAELAACELQIGAVYAAIGKVRPACQYYQRALALQEAQDLPAEIATTLMRLGALGADQGDSAAAQEYYDRAYHIRERLGVELDLAGSYQGFGDLHTLRQEFRLARHCYQHAQEILERLGLEAPLATTYQRQGRLATFQADYPAAGRYLERARAIQERLTLAVELARTYTQLGELAAHRHQPAQAGWWYARARQIQERLGLVCDLVKTLRQQALLWEQEREYRHAEQAMHQVVNIQKKLRHPDRKADIQILERLRRRIYSPRERLRRAWQRWRKQVARLRHGPPPHRGRKP